MYNHKIHPKPNLRCPREVPEVCKCVKMKVKMQEYDVSQQSLVLEDLIVQHPVELMLFSRLKKSLSGI